MDETNTSLAELLKPYRTQAIQNATGASRSNAHNWRAGNTIPAAVHLPGLAVLLRVDLGELTRIVAQDSTRRASARVSRQGQVA